MSTLSRVRELEEILRFAIDGLRSKARVARNDHISGNRTDAVEVLTAAADELQAYLGSRVERVSEPGSSWVNCNLVEVTIDGQTRQFGPLAEPGPVATVRVEVLQEQSILHHPVAGTVAARPVGMAVKIEVIPRPNSEISKGATHGHPIH